MWEQCLLFASSRLRSTSTLWGSWMSARNPSLLDRHEYILAYSKQRYAREGESQTDTISREDFLECCRNL